jgi:hypothetical protein
MHATLLEYAIQQQVNAPLLRLLMALLVMMDLDALKLTPVCQECVLGLILSFVLLVIHVCIFKMTGGRAYFTSILTCNNNNGMCETSNAADGISCDDSNLCTQTDTCISGYCFGSNLVMCTGLNNCYEDNECDSSTGMTLMLVQMFQLYIAAHIFSRVKNIPLVDENSFIGTGKILAVGDLFAQVIVHMICAHTIC